MGEHNTKIENSLFIGGNVSGKVINQVGPVVDRTGANPEAGSSSSRLTGSLCKAITRALLGAFPTHDALKQLVRFHLDQNLENIARGATHKDEVFNLVAWAEANGKLEELLRGASEENSGNPELQALLLAWSSSQASGA